MSKPEKKQLWVRFPKGEAKLCLMEYKNTPGLFLMHKDTPAGRSVMEKAEKIGFRTVRRPTGTASMMLRGPNGYPFGIRSLAQALGGVAIEIPLSVIRAEAFPRKEAPKPEAAATVSEPAVETIEVKIEGAADAEAPASSETVIEAEPETKAKPEPVFREPNSDASVGSQIMALIQEVTLHTDPKIEIVAAAEKAPEDDTQASFADHEMM